MLKKPGAILLIVLYTITVAGFGLNVHYCFNKVASFSISSPAKNCGMLTKSKMKCCNEKHLNIKVKDAHQGQSLAFEAKATALQLPHFAYNSFSFLTSREAAVNDHYRGPPYPLFDAKTSFIKNRIFRI